MCFLDTWRHNSREKQRNATLIIEMQDKSTTIKDPSAPEIEPKKFTFDFSYWSHDDFTEREDGYLTGTTARYADQVGRNGVYGIAGVFDIGTYGVFGHHVGDGVINDFVPACVLLPD